MLRKKKQKPRKAFGVLNDVLKCWLIRNTSLGKHMVVFNEELGVKRNNIERQMSE